MIPSKRYSLLCIIKMFTISIGCIIFFYNFANVFECKYRRIMERNTKLLCFCLAFLSLGLTACKKDYFDQEAYDQLVKQSFPVEDIDEQHTWATMGSAVADVTVLGDYEEKYTLCISLENPLSSNTLTSLYETDAKSGDVVSATITYPLDQEYVYLALYDSKGRRLVESAKIENNHIEAAIGIGTTTNSRFRAKEAETPDYARTANGYLNPVVEVWGNRYETYNITEDDMKAYTPLTNSSFSGVNNHTLSDLQYLPDGTYYIGHGDGKHYRIPAGTELTETFNINASWGKVNERVIYVEGILHLNGNTLNGPTLVVANGGEIVIDGRTEMSNSGRFVVLSGGKISGKDNVVFKIANGMPCYNAGTIEYDGELDVNGSDTYNKGYIHVDLLRNTSNNGRFTNFGRILARTNMDAADAYNSSVVNGCQMHFTENAGIGTLTMLTNSRLDVDGRAQFNQSTQTLNHLTEINVGTLYVNSTTFAGPSGSSTYAVIKAKRVMANQGYDLKMSDNVYLDWNTDSLYNYNGDLQTLDNPWSIKGIIKAQNFKYVNEETAPNGFVIPAGDCCGNGFNDAGNNGAQIPESTPLSYRYCFEDNFPQLGDYDFNDAVITVTPTISGKNVSLKVSLDAVGASEQIAAAIRIVGLKSSSVVSCTREGDFDSNYPSTGYRIIDNFSDNGLLPDDMKNNTTDVVIKLFNNAHWSLGRTMQSNGSILNWFFNTVKRDDAFSNKINDITPTEVTYNFELISEEAAASFVQDCLDVFIVEGYNGGYWEVHTVPFKTDEVLRAWASGTKQAYANNFPWAICVPGNFLYPLEWQCIGLSKGTEREGAYETEGHSFAEWAKDHTKATDWYKYPTMSKVYK